MTAVDSYTFYELDAPDRADTLVIAYGVTVRAARAALQDLRAKGRRVALLALKTLYPVPENLIRNCLAGMKKVVVVEMNLGQYVREIQRLAGTTEVVSYGQMNGELISPRQIIEVVAS